MVESVWSRLVAHATASPDRPALLQGDRVFTFAEWRRLAECYASWFASHGCRPGDRILLWMNAGPEMAAAMLGTWQRGAIFALMDPRAKADHLHHAVRTIGPRLVCVDPAVPLPAPLDIPTVAVTDLDRSAHVPAAQPLLPTDPASIVFTSGSTGRPKGVTQSHGNLARGCAAVASYLGLTADDRILCTVPWSFDYGYGQMLSTTHFGVTQVLPAHPNPFSLCDAITRHRPTVLAGVPSQFTYLLRGVSPFRQTDVSSIRMVTNTGGTIPAGVLDDLLAMFPDRRIVLNYGLTETYRTSFLDPSLVHTHRDSIGRAIPGAAVAIVRDDGTPAAVDEVGEIIHRGDYVCLGYWNDPEATARAIRPDPFAVSGCARPPVAVFTGDLGRIDAAGLLYYCGRRDRQLKVMGVRVNPGEIEEALYRSGLVHEVAVVARKHDMLGHEVWAVVVASPDTPVDAVAYRLKDHCRATLSPYMVPQRFLVKDALPKTTSGKTDYPRLDAEVGAAR